MIREVTPQSVISSCRTALGITGVENGIDDILLSSLLRHCAGILCPCSRTALRAALIESLAYLGVDGATLAERLEKLVDDLIVSGDLLELSDVATEDPHVKGTWVFAAPPSFIVRASGSAFLSGIVPDQNTFLPTSLAERIIYSGSTRYVLPEAGEDLVEALSAQGLNQLTETVWLKAPKKQTPQELAGRLRQQLASHQICGPINDLMILDPTKKVTYYLGRWVAPTIQTGAFIARRPQEFGAPIWSFVELVSGTPTRIMDLPSRHYRWRGCDAAWHLQMAIDYCAGQPQQYRRSITDQGVRFDFFSPLPLWAQRRLMIFGCERQRDNSLLAYEIPMAESDEEEKQLQENLWLVRAEEE